MSEKEEKSERREVKVNDDISEVSGSEGEYSMIDVSDNPLFQILSAFFENDDGETICDHLKKVSDSIDRNTEMLSKLLERLALQNH